jgi:hypothetical protein
MSRHIHIPAKIEWATFLANSGEIDNYLVSPNELLRVRYAPAPRRLALAMTDSCNLLWDFVTSASSPDLHGLARAINEALIDGGVQEGVVYDPNLLPAPRLTREPTHLDKKTDFLYSDIDSTLQSWVARFAALDHEGSDFLDRKCVPVPFQKDAAMFAWLSQYQWAHWCPFTGLNGMTGRYLTNALRLRWSMPLWACDIKKDSWWSNLDTYSKIWLKKGSFHPIEEKSLPNLEKLNLVSQHSL